MEGGPGVPEGGSMLVTADSEVDLLWRTVLEVHRLMCTPAGVPPGLQELIRSKGGSSKGSDSL